MGAISARRQFLSGTTKVSTNACCPEMTAWLTMSVNTIHAQKGFILDGYPRTLPQAEKLDGLVGNGKGDLRVLQLLVPDDVIVKRIALRRSCPQCRDPEG